MPNFLVTGATGFLGTYVLNALGQYGKVYAVGRRPINGLTTGSTWVSADLTRPGFTANLPSDVDVIIHLAQSRHFKEPNLDPGDLFAVNCRSTLQLLDYGVKSGAQSFVYTSSGSVYLPSYGHLDEDSPTGPSSPYATSKICAESLIRAHASDMRRVILRPFFLYGPFQQQLLVADLMDRIWRGEEITVQGDGGMKFTPTYVEDAADLVVAAARFEDLEGTFNVAGPQDVNLKDLCMSIASMLGRRPALRPETGVAPSYLAHASAIREAVPEARITNVEDGLSRMVEVFLRGAPLDGPARETS